VQSSVAETGTKDPLGVEEQPLCAEDLQQLRSLQDNLVYRPIQKTRARRISQFLGNVSDLLPSLIVAKYYSFWYSSL
jgi:hypothetical protein